MKVGWEGAHKDKELEHFNVCDKHTGSEEEEEVRLYSHHPEQLYNRDNVINSLPLQLCAET